MSDAEYEDWEPTRWDLEDDDQEENLAEDFLDNPRCDQIQMEDDK